MKKTLRTQLGQFGDVVSCRLFPEQCYAFVTFSRKDDARFCVSKLNGSKGRRGQQLSVCIAVPDFTLPEDIVHRGQWNSWAPQNDFAYGFGGFGLRQQAWQEFGGYHLPFAFAGPSMKKRHRKRRRYNSSSSSSSSSCSDSSSSSSSTDNSLSSVVELRGPDPNTDGYINNMDNLHNQQLLGHGAGSSHGLNMKDHQTHKEGKKKKRRNHKHSHKYCHNDKKSKRRKSRHRHNK